VRRAVTALAAGSVAAERVDAGSHICRHYVAGVATRTARPLGDSCVSSGWPNPPGTGTSGLSAAILAGLSTLLGTVSVVTHGDKVLGVGARWRFRDSKDDVDSLRADADGAK
jgi:hypothetical protein